MSNSITKTICEKLINWHFVREAKVFELLCANPTIDKAFQTTRDWSIPPRRWLNLHDKDHALAVAAYAIQLYEFIFLDQPPIAKPSTADVGISLVSTLLAAYIHDLARWAKDQHAGRVLAEIQEYLYAPLIEQYSRQDVQGLILVNVKQWVEKHDDVNYQVESMEEGIVKLADKLDCHSRRAYTKEDGSPLPASEVLRKDPQPWQYFGCIAIPQPVILVKDTGKRRIRITVPIVSYAAAPAVKAILQATECMERIGLSENMMLFLKLLHVKGKPLELIWPDAIGLSILDDRTIWQAIAKTGLDYEDFTARLEYNQERPFIHLYLELHNEKGAEEIESLVNEKLTAIDRNYENWLSLLDLPPIGKVTLLSKGTFQRYVHERMIRGCDISTIKPPHVNASDDVIHQLLQLSQASQ